MNREQILERLDGDVSLPALPEVLARLDEVLSDPDVDVRNIAHLVSTDPVLAGQVLRMANSAYYARGGAPATALAAGIQRLGLKTIKGLVYALTLPRLFGGGGDFPHRRLWRHALAVGAFSKELAALTGGDSEEREKVYLAGLVHDVGSLLLAGLAPREYAPWLRSLGESGNESWTEMDLTHHERETFGIDHAEVGAIFLETRWHMPTPAPQVARHHHDLGWLQTESDPGLRRSVLIVHVANGVCNHAGLSWDRIPPSGGAFREGAWELLGLDLAQVDELLGKVRDSVRMAEELLALGE